MTAKDAAQLIGIRMPEFWSKATATLDPSDIDGLYPLLALLFDFSVERWNKNAHDKLFETFFETIEVLLKGGDDTVTDATAIELIHPISSPQYKVAEWIEKLGPAGRTAYESYMDPKHKTS